MTRSINELQFNVLKHIVNAKLKVCGEQTKYFSLTLIRANHLIKSMFWILSANIFVAGQMNALRTHESNT